VVVKTKSGSRSGVTHAGGRYVHKDNPYGIELMREMRDHRPLRSAHADRGFPVDEGDLRPIETNAHARSALVMWWHVSSELFADLFEDWMRGENKVGWDQCEPKSLNMSEAPGDPFVRTRLMPGVRAQDVRSETYRLFAAGIRWAADLPPVRPGMFGGNTDEMVGHLPEALRRAKAE
jgi:hypothetical protein